MEKQTHNGWVNYATWLVNLWIDNDGGSDYWRERAVELAQEKIDSGDTDDILSDVASDLADEIKYQIEEQSPAGVNGMYADLINAALGEVAWREIAEHMTDDIVIYSAGWNMPGYLCDSEPVFFLDADDAMEYIKDAAKQSIHDDCASVGDDTSAYILCASVDSWEADKNGGFGVTFRNYHYFVSRV